MKPAAPCPRCTSCGCHGIQTCPSPNKILTARVRFGARIRNFDKVSDKGSDKEGGTQPEAERKMSNLQTLRAWGGKLKHPIIPVAWVQIGKTYVSFHLMGIYMKTPLLGGMSKELKARMQGKTCFIYLGATPLQ